MVKEIILIAGVVFYAMTITTLLGDIRILLAIKVTKISPNLS